MGLIASERKGDRGRLVAHRTQRGGQAELADHAGGELGGADQIVGCTRRAFTEDDQFCRAAVETNGELIGEVAFAVEMPLGLGELLGSTQRHTRRQDGYLVYRVGVFAQRGQQRVPGLVHRHGMPLLGEQRVGCVPPAQQNAVAGCRQIGCKGTVT